MATATTTTAMTTATTTPTATTTTATTTPTAATTPTPTAAAATVTTAAAAATPTVATTPTATATVTTAAATPTVTTAATPTATVATAATPTAAVTTAAAAAAAATSSAEPSDSECSICHEPFKDPKVLWCGHELCAACLLTLLTSQRDAPCPLCRRPILPLSPPPGSGQSQSVQSFVDGLPTDVAMQAWVESDRLLSQQHACSSCLTQAADSLCLHCRDFLCGPCVAMHGRLSATRHHQVEMLSSLTPQKLLAGAGGWSRSAFCQAHPSEVSKLFCSTHRASICLLCATSKHRNCPEVKDAEERKAETRALLTEAVTSLTEEESALDEVLRGLDAAERDLEQGERKAQGEISAVFDHLEAALKRRRLQASEEVRSKFAQCRAPARDTRAGVLERRGPVTANKALAERGRTMAACGDMGDMALALKSRADEMRKATRRGGSAAAEVLPAVTMATFLMNRESLFAVERALAEIVQVKVTPAAEVSQFSFHYNCGKNIVFTRDRQTAERNGGKTYGGIVVCSQPMVPQRLYEVHLDQIDPLNGWYMLVGAVTSPPSGLTLPTMADRWASAVVFCDNHVQVHGTLREKDVGRKLVDLPQGSRVGVMVDGRGSLHLCINGEAQGNAGTSLTQPCFAFFDVLGPYRKVTALPVTVLP